MPLKVYNVEDDALCIAQIRSCYMALGSSAHFLRDVVTLPTDGGPCSTALQTRNK